ncbi:MAG: hypothetical protein QG630_367 [Patescibacteria group bacterium]|nr:hypothetical protein [Patescibacteria group bacterium]
MLRKVIKDFFKSNNNYSADKFSTEKNIMKNMTTKINTNSFYKNALFLGIITLSLFNLSNVHAQSITNKIEVEGASKQKNEEKRGDDEKGRGKMIAIEKGQKNVFGTITAINGNTLTMSVTFRGEGKNSTTTTKIFTVDASTAKIIKSGATSSVSSIVIGDKVSILGRISGTNITAKIIHIKLQNTPQGDGKPVVGGKITSISGNTLTITNNSNVSYTIDVSNAKIFVKGATSSVSSLQINGEIVVQGTVNGTNITATSILAHQDVKNNKPLQKNEGVLQKSKNFFRKMFGF